MRKTSQLEKDQIGSRFPSEAEHYRDRVFAGRGALTAAQNKVLLRGGLEGMKLPLILWLGYLIGLQQGIQKKSGR